MGQILDSDISLPSSANENICGFGSILVGFFKVKRLPIPNARL